MSADLVPVGVKDDLQRNGARIESALAYLEARTITTGDDAKWANDRLHDVKAQWKLLEERRTTVTKPLHAALREVNGWFKPVQSALEKAEQILKGKLGDYMRATTAAREVAMLEVSAGNNEALAATAPAAPLEGIGVREVWDFDVTDPDAVPRELCTPDPAKIKKAIWYANTPTKEPRPIPGISFRRRSQVSVR